MCTMQCVSVAAADSQDPPVHDLMTACWLVKSLLTGSKAGMTTRTPCDTTLCTQPSC